MQVVIPYVKALKVSKAPKGHRLLDPSKPEITLSAEELAARRKRDVYRIFGRELSERSLIGGLFDFIFR
jgi:hypothetical protein